MLLAVRRDASGIKRYAHLGTGNYHTKTTRLYTDYGLMTSDVSVCQDVHKIFQELTGMGKAARLKHLRHAPFTLHRTLLDLIEFETAEAFAGRIMEALFRASQAGVEIELIVRGICCLRPGIPGLSDNIRVRSVVDRFLEHSRVHYFYHGGEELVYCSSADWMDRNLFNRVETCFPILAPELKQRVIDDGLKPYLEDNCQAWFLRPDGHYDRVRPGSEEAPRSAQGLLLERRAGQVSVSS
jgi:polyphosphate kinase